MTDGWIRMTPPTYVRQVDPSSVPGSVFGQVGLFAFWEMYLRRAERGRHYVIAYRKLAEAGSEQELDLVVAAGGFGSDGVVLDMCFPEDVAPETRRRVRDAWRTTVPSASAFAQARLRESLAAALLRKKETGK